MHKRILTTLLFFLLYSSANGQSVQEIESRVSRYLDLVQKWDTSYSDPHNEDSLTAIQKELLTYLKNVCINNIPLLKADLAVLKDKGMQILTSDDGKFRIYCWSEGHDFGVHSWYNLAQYRSKSGTKSKILNDVSQMEEHDAASGDYYSELQTITTKTNKTIYLALGSQKAAMGLYINDIQAFSIVNDTLDGNSGVFKTKKDSFSTIRYSFESSLSGNNDADIKLSADKRKIYIPVVTEDGRVTSKHLVYVFDGNKYVFDKNAK